MPSYPEVQNYLQSRGLESLAFEQATPDAQSSACSVGCSVAEIAKTMLVKVGVVPVVVIASGDMKINSSRLKDHSGLTGKVTFPEAEEVARVTGYKPGGVSPFLLPSHLPVFVDISLQRFEAIFSAAGNDHSAVRLSWLQLLEFSGGSSAEVCTPVKY